MKEYKYDHAAADRYLAGLEFISTGLCPGCSECGLGAKDCEDCDGTGETDEGHVCKVCQGVGTIAPTIDEVPDEEPGFSWSSCEVCGSTLGGNRYTWHAQTKDGKLVHGECCEDCMMHMNYGT